MVCVVLKEAYTLSRQASQKLCTAATVRAFCGLIV
jgi:hypothetical protein